VCIVQINVLHAKKVFLIFHGTNHESNIKIAFHYGPEMTEITAHNVQTQPTTTMATIRSSAAAVAAEKVSLKF